MFMKTLLASTALLTLTACATPPNLCHINPWTGDCNELTPFVPNDSDGSSSRNDVSRDDTPGDDGEDSTDDSDDDSDDSEGDNDNSGNDKSNASEHNGKGGNNGKGGKDRDGSKNSDKGKK